MSPTSPRRVNRILVCGSGLAAQMVVTALSRKLPATVHIIWVKGQVPDTDLFYGNVTSPSAYDFNLSLGVNETNLVLNSTTAFSFGTQYLRWCARSWVQGFQQPMPVVDGALLHHYLTQQKITGLEPFLISAIAGRMGRFAHPPEAGNHPLAKAEYGYQLDLPSYIRLFEAVMDNSHVQVITAEISSLETNDTGLTQVHLSDGQSLSADLYVDCTGPEAKLLSALPGHFHAHRRLRAYSSLRPTEKLGPALRQLTAHDFGWQSDTPVQGGSVRLSVCDPDSSEGVQEAHTYPVDRTAEIVTGRQDKAWRGNCVAIGHAAGIAEPLTPAPFILLQQDVQRLLLLLPFDAEDMSVERKDFNRLFHNHFEHVQLFNAAFFELDNLPATPYWHKAKAQETDPLLARKTEQFSSRGLHVSYDDELLNQEDWITLHYGLRHVPARYDRSVDRANPAKVKQYLIEVQNQIEAAAKAMPLHDVYMNGLRQYLIKQKE